MQITLNIDSSTIGGTVQQVFAELSSDEKKELAKQVMLEVLQKPQEAERIAYEQVVIREMIEQYSNSSYSGERMRNEEEVRANYKFRERMSKFRSTSEVMMSEIVAATIGHYKSLVEDLVKNDEQLNARYVEMREQFVKDFPNVIQSAMAMHFASQMGSISGMLMQSFGIKQGVGNIAQSLQNQLAGQGIHVQLPQAM